MSKGFSALIYLFLMFGTFGCSTMAPKKVEPLYDVLNQTFLEMVDTTAYETGNMIVVPGFKYSFFKLDHYALFVDINWLRDDIKKSLEEIINSDPLLKEFKQVLDSPFVDKRLDLTKIHNTGKYRLVSTHTRDRLAINGKVYFYRPYIAGNRAILPMEISDNAGKGGYGCVFFFEKINGIWVKLKWELINWI